MNQDIIEKARDVRIEDETASRGIRLHGRIDRCGPCPVCGGDDRFSINVRKQVFLCRGCNAAGDVIALVQHLDGLSFQEAVETLADSREPRPERRQPPARTAEPARPQFWPILWERALDPRGTLVEIYLATRRLILPDIPRDTADYPPADCIRFDPDCKFGAGPNGVRHPAMVVLVHNILTNAPQAIQRTALTADGTALKHNGKTLRMSLGPTAGGAVKLSPDEDVEQGLCIGEGVETVLAGMQRFGLRPAWALIGTTGLACFPVLPGIEGLHILTENDANGANARAVAECTERWREAGCDVFHALPEPEFNDLADELKAAMRCG